MRFPSWFYRPSEDTVRLDYRSIPLQFLTKAELRQLIVDHRMLEMDAADRGLRAAVDAVR